jgi:hypothetical protein
MLPLAALGRQLEFRRECEGPLQPPLADYVLDSRSAVEECLRHVAGRGGRTLFIFEEVAQEALPIAEKRAG